MIETIKRELETDADYCGAVGVIYGGISDEARADAVLNFQNDPAMRVIIVGIQAGGFGLTLTAATAVAFVQYPFSPGELDQAVDRVHRIGQGADSVTIYNLVAEGTVEELILELISSKRNVINAVIDGT